MKSNRLCESNLRIFLILTVLLLISSHSYASNRPSKLDLQSAIQDRLPAIMKIHSLKIIASENMGTSVTPNITQRFIAKGKTSKPLYRADGYVIKKIVLEKTANSGESFSVYGLSHATRYRENWRFSFGTFDLDGSEKLKTAKGHPISHWKKGTYVFKNTKEWTNLVAKEKAQKLEKQKRKQIESDIRRKHESDPYWRDREAKALKMFMSAHELRNEVPQYANQNYDRRGNNLYSEKIIRKVIALLEEATTILQSVKQDYPKTLHVRNGNVDWKLKEHALIITANKKDLEVAIKKGK